MNAKAVMRVKELMRTGEVIAMAYPLNAAIPLFDGENLKLDEMAA